MFGSAEPRHHFCGWFATHVIIDDQLVHSSSLVSLLSYARDNGVLAFPEDLVINIHEYINKNENIWKIHYMEKMVGKVRETG